MGQDKAGDDDKQEEEEEKVLNKKGDKDAKAGLIKRNMKSSKDLKLKLCTT